MLARRLFVSLSGGYPSRGPMAVATGALLPAACCGAKEILPYATLCYTVRAMSTVIRVSDNLAKEAKTRSKVERRSMTAQLEYWATIGKAAEENPDLPFSFIKETLLARQEMKEHPKEEYTFG
jgi:hypothetical protein